MNKRLWSILMGICGLMVLAACVAPAGAQEVKPKPPLYSYIANWQIPRANWADMNKGVEPVNAIMEKAMADGTIVAYGHDENEVHSADLETHDNWWSAMSIAGLLKVLDQLRSSNSSNSPALAAATKHWDEVYVSRYYNWKSGPYKGAYTRVAEYKLKADAPDNALEMLSEHLIVPLLEKLLANGAIVEYEIDTQAIHTENPNEFAIVYIAPNPEGLDTVQSAIMDSIKSHPLSGQAFGSMTEDSAHRDELIRGDGAYK